MKALIENIQHYSLHDGPGIRTTVFFKGCPLRCRWCSNPTTQNPGRELLQKRNDCLAAAACADLCPRGAIRAESGPALLDRALCDACGRCAGACPGKALLMAGREYSLDEVLVRIKKDMLFTAIPAAGSPFPAGRSCRSTRLPWNCAAAAPLWASIRPSRPRVSLPMSISGPWPWPRT